MNLKSLFVAILLLGILKSSSATGRPGKETFFSQPIDIQDSLALVDLYNSTNGPGWVNHTNWLSSSPVGTWYGITVFNDRVWNLDLESNRLFGTLPSLLGDLTFLNIMSLKGNGLTGTIPSSLANLVNLTLLDLSYNQLSGSIPASFNDYAGNFTFFDFDFNYLSGTIPSFANTSYASFDFTHNQFDFSSFETLDHPNSTVSMTPQANLPLLNNGATLSVAAGGHVSENTYRWYKDGNLVATKTGDSTFTPVTAGDYSVIVSSSAIGLVLYSITPTNVQDSLLLVDLYNNTGGPGWTKRNNWLSPAPVGTWYGVTVRNERVTQLEISYNNLTGNLPASLANMPLNGLYLDNNKFTGSIPLAFTHMQNLDELNLGGNQLTGQIPPFSNLPNLNTISLGNNQLSGPLPMLTNLPQLESLVLSGNQLTDTIPAAYANYPRLTIFEVNHNQLKGNIPNFLCNANMRLLMLDDNLFTGTLPDSIGKLASTTTITIHNNQLSGPIPAAINKFQWSLTSIANNKFTFAGMENLPIYNGGIIYASYSPQANIPLIRKGDTLYVRAGGTTATETFQLYKDGALVRSQTGDSAFAIPGTGKYNILSTSTIAPLLTLYSDTLGAQLILPAVTIDTSQIISGAGLTDINSGIFQLVSLTPSPGPNGLTGKVNALVTVDTAVSAFHGKPFVQRHYDITPDFNASNAQATVTLYFTQQDFDAYNNYVRAKNLAIPLLPTDGIDNGNVRVTQYHGQFTGSSNPANYGQDTLLIVPVVSWDAVNSWWTVSFSVNGFSGFFVSSGSASSLPLTLLEFTGKFNVSSVDLQWQTTSEVNTSRFIVEHSSDGMAFSSIGEVTANSRSGTNRYAFTDLHPFAGRNFYRLKMIDIDDRFSYTAILSIELSLANGACLIYPNPARNSTSLLFNAATSGKFMVRIADESGRVLKQVSGTSVVGMNKVDLLVDGYSAGVYTIIIIDEEQGLRNYRLLKD